MSRRLFEMCKIRAARILSVLTLSSGVIGFQALAQAPGEVTNLRWCAGSRDCVEWDPAAGASEYKLYRGDLLQLPALLNGYVDSCLEGTYPQTTTGPSMGDVPAAGGVRWYIATAMNVGGEGTAGSATAGPRIVDPSGSCQAECAPDGGYCLMSSECCNGSCVGYYCAACVADSGTCSLDGDPCCTGSCVDGMCGGMMCVPGGGYCVMNSECCSGSCDGNYCVDCVPNGGMCSMYSAPCCTGSCMADMCGGMPMCLPYGASCTMNSQCCSGNCYSYNGYSYCYY